MCRLRAVSIFSLVLLIESCGGPDQRPFIAPNAPVQADSTADANDTLEELRATGIRLAREGHLVKARAVFEDGLRQAEAAGSVSYRIRFLTNIANVDFEFHRYRDAMASYLGARTLAGQAGDSRLVAVLSQNIAWLYGALNAPNEAAASLDEALENLGEAAKPEDRAVMRLCKGALLAERGDHDAAQAEFWRALSDADISGDAALQARVLDNFGYRSIESNPVLAEALLLNSFRIRTLHRIPVSPYWYKNYALLKHALGELNAAEVYVTRALDSAHGSPTSLPVWSLLYQRALIRSELGRPREALADLDESLRHIRNLRVGLLPAEAVRESAGVALQKVYDLYVSLAGRIAAESGDTRLLRRAFEVAEQNRAAALRESLDIAESQRERLPNEYWEALNQLAAAEGQVFRGKQMEDGESVRRLRLRLTELEISAGLRDSSAPAEFKEVSVTELQRSLRESEAVLAFQTAQEQSYLWAITRQHMEFRLLDGREELRRGIEGFRRELARDAPEHLTSGERLFQALFGKLTPRVSAKPDWVLLLDGPLFELPFAALTTSRPDGSHRYLIEDHSFRVVPAAAMLLDRQAGHWTGPMLAVADPVYNAADPRFHRSHKVPLAVSPVVAGLTRLQRPIQADTSLALSRLAASAAEAAACGRVFNAAGQPPILLTGTDATETRIRQGFRHHPSVVHLATHVIPSPDDEKSAQIALSLNLRGEITLLSPTRISALSIRPGLVVMSGCSSGSGKVLPGEGLLGLTRAWLRAGAVGVGATLWPTRDHGGELLQSFYRSLQGIEGGEFRQPPHRALRQAQLEMLDSVDWKSRPEYWAAYFLVTNR